MPAQISIEVLFLTEYSSRIFCIIILPKSGATALPNPAIISLLFRFLCFDVGL